MISVTSDIRTAFRSFSRSPAFTTAAVLSLALGIGANTAIFTVTNALLFEPLPYADADRLAILWNRSPGIGIEEDWFSTAQYFDIRTSHSGFEDLAIAYGANANLSSDGEPERIGVIRVSSNIFPLLGVSPLHGRLFESDDDIPGGPAVALLNYGTWMRRYGGDPAVVGRSIRLNGQPYQVVGVLPESFSLPREVLPTLGVVADGEVMLPLPLGAEAATIRIREDYNILGKLKAGVSVEEAQAEMDGLTARLREDYPDLYPPSGGLTFSIVPLIDEVVGDVRRPLLVLLGAVGFVLLIACANVANLMLSRAMARRKEMAVRAALGASRLRLLRQTLTESLALSGAGGLLGVLIAMAGVRWLHALQPPNVPRLAAIAVNGDVLAAAFGISVLAGVLFGLVPALGSGRLDLQQHLKDAGRGSAGSHSVWGRGHHLRRLLIAGELAMSVMLLIGAGLLIRSFAYLQQVPAGFSTDRVLTFEVSMTGEKYADVEIVRETFRTLWNRLEALPGVTLAGSVTPLPLTDRFAWGPITVEGRPPPAGQAFINADQRLAGGHYFEAMGIPLIEGRLFDDTDRAGAERVVIVDERMARDLWPGESPVGKRVRFGDINAEGPWDTVVGVVGQVKHYGLDANSRIALYWPASQRTTRTMFVVLRTEQAPETVTSAVRAAVDEIDADLPISNVATMDTRLERSLARREFAMLLLAVFAGLALALATVGIYGVMAYVVAQGRRELGIRMALGSTPGSVVRLVLLHGLAITLVGLAAGLAGALLLTRLLANLLFGVAATDPVTFVAVAGLLGLVALAACYVPARRAGLIDPMRVLRDE